MRIGTHKYNDSVNGMGIFMTKSINRVGIVGAVILIAMILLSSSGLGYSWEPTEHTRAYWDNDRSSASLDAVQVVNVFNGNGLQI